MTNLPRGVRIDHNYVQVRLSVKGVTYCKNFGPDSPKARELAIIHLSKKREEILLGKFGYAPELPAKSFKEVSRIFFDIWQAQLTPEGTPKHTKRAIQNYRSFLDASLIPYFGPMEFHLIKRLDVQTWRDLRTKTILGTSANREQAVLRGMFNYVKEWIGQEKIPPFKQPSDNPCEFVELAANRKRERVLSLIELQSLKEACYALEDKDMWEICTMALKSLLRKKDLLNIESGLSISLTQAKTGVDINLPLQVSKPLIFANFRKRWDSARKGARLHDCQFRDLRKTGANLLKNKNWSNKIISEVLGHTNTRTTEVYMVKDQEHLRKPLEDLASIVDNI